MRQFTFCLVLGLYFARISSCYAHGERAQEPSLRMRTIQWYDVTWSTEKLAVNEVLIVKGKFRVSRYWPDAVPLPNVAFLNISTPGPVFVRLGSYINGVSMVNSTSLKVGRDYAWEVHLKARFPGRWHVHSLLNVEGAGPIVGPGKYVEIIGDHSDFTNKIQLINGETIDLEHYGLKTNIFWHLFWAFMAFIWLFYWLRKPLFFHRNAIVKLHQAKSLITENDKMVAFIFLVIVLAMTFGAYQFSEFRWPKTIALQSSRTTVEPLPVLAEEVKVKLIKAVYRVPGRSMTMNVKLINNTQKTIRLGEFNTATVRFINKDIGLVGEDSKSYPPYLLALGGLTLSDNRPIGPGETRIFDVIARDAAWVTERLSSLIYDPDSRFAGLLFFYDEDNNRYISSLGGYLSPRFF